MFVDGCRLKRVFFFFQKKVFVEECVLRVFFQRVVFPKGVLFLQRTFFKVFLRLCSWVL